MKCLLYIISSICCWMSVTEFSSAQEIKFGQYGNYALNVQELNSDDLSFGKLTKNSGLHTVDINNAKIVSITGVKYLDIILEINGEPSLYLNGNPANAGDPQKTIPLTLEAAYANNKGTPTISNATIINMVNNSATVRIPILERQNLAPGPPPAPPTNSFDQSLVEETAYLYLYGSINAGEVNSGSYESTITITINYD